MLASGGSGNSLVPTIIGGVLALIGGVLAIYFRQRDRGEDKSDARLMASAQARVDDSKAALDAWMQINAAHVQQLATRDQQIANLDTRLIAVQKRAEHCEDVVVPKLEATVEAQRKTVARLSARITALEKRKP